MRGLSALKSGMISQLIRRLSKFAYVGDIASFTTVSKSFASWRLGKIFCLNHQCGNTPTLAEVWGTHKPEVRSRWKDGKTYAEIKRLKRNI